MANHCLHVPTIKLYWGRRGWVEVASPFHSPTTLLSNGDMIFKCRKYFLCKSSAKGSATQSQYANGHNTDSCVVYQKWSLLSQLLGMVLAITQCSSLVECNNCYPAYVVYRTLTTLYNTMASYCVSRLHNNPS